MPFSDGKALLAGDFQLPLAYILIIPQVWAFVKTLFYFFEEGRRIIWQVPISILRSLLSSLHSYYTTDCFSCQGVFHNFFKKFRGRERPHRDLNPFPLACRGLTFLSP